MVLCIAGGIAGHCHQRPGQLVDLSHIDLNLLVVLNAIVSEGGITRASEKLKVTQPAVSHSLAKLRDLLGDPVFVREGHSMVPTPLTRRLVPSIELALAEILRSLNQTATFNPMSSTREFFIGMARPLERRMLPELYERFRTRAPSAAISCFLHDRDTMAVSLDEGQLDLVLDEMLLPASRVEMSSLSASDRVMVARVGHALVSRAIDLGTYLALDHVLVSSGHGLEAPEDTELRRLGKKRRVVLRCQDFQSACRIVSRTDLILTMPSMYLPTHVDMSGLKLHKLPFEAPPFELFVYTASSAKGEAGNEWLRAQVEECFL